MTQKNLLNRSFGTQRAISFRQIKKVSETMGQFSILAWFSLVQYR